MLFVLRIRRPPRSKGTVTRFPDTTLVRSKFMQVVQLPSQVRPLREQQVLFLVEDIRPYPRQYLTGLHALVFGYKYLFDTTRHNRFDRSEEHTSELQSLMRISYAVFCLKKKTIINFQPSNIHYIHSQY